VLADPRLSGGFGGERADPGRIALRDADLHGERPGVNRDHPVGRLGVGMGPFHWLDLSGGNVQKSVSLRISATTATGASIGFLLVLLVGWIASQSAGFGGELNRTPAIL